MADRLLRISVVGCQNLLNKDTEHLSELTDPVVAVYEGNQPKPILITPQIVNSCHPTYDAESASVDVRVTSGTVLTFQVWHQYVDEKRGAFLGELKLSADRMREDSGKIIDVLGARAKEKDPMVKSMSESETATLGCIHIAWMPAQSTAVSEAQRQEYQALPLLGYLSVLHARNLLRRDTEPELLSDPYFCVSFPSKDRLLYTSKSIPCTLNPTWEADETSAYLIELRGLETGSLRLELWNENPRPERDSFLGAVVTTPVALSDGKQKLELTPRPNEADLVIRRLEGRLGWVTVAWKPCGEMAARCRERMRNRDLGLQSSGAAGADAAAASRVAQWTPAQLNDYLKSIRPHSDAPASAGGPGQAQANSTTTITSAGSGVRGPPIPVEKLSKFSPYYPHADPDQTLKGSAILSGVVPTANNSNTTATLVRSTNPIGSTAPPPAGGGASGATTYPRADAQTGTGGTVIESSVSGMATQQLQQQQEGAGVASSRIATVDVPYLVPIRVGYGGSFFDTQLALDEPLSNLQQDAERFFHVHRDVQLFSHNGEVKNPALSLRHNGCLLLKGDPHIKLTMSVAKGPLRNLVFVFPDKREVALAVSELATVNDVKEILCDEFGREKGLEALLADPRDLQLLWRYNDLNGKASIQYYNIPTNAKLNVAKKPKFNLDGRREEAAEPVYESSGATHQRPAYSRTTTTTSTSGAAKTVSYESTSRARTRDDDRKEVDAMRRNRNRNVDDDDRVDDKRKGSSSSRRMSSADKGARTTRSKSADAKRTHSGSRAAPDVAERPRAYYEYDDRNDDPELAMLRQTVRDLEQQVRQQTAQQKALHQDQQDKRVAALEKMLLESDGRYRDAVQRIAELESTVTRYQQLLQRATQLSKQPPLY